MRKVVLPQAFRVIIPPTGNEFIAMMKDTALVSFLGVTAASAEVFRRSQLVGKADFKNLEAYVAAALVYWGLTVIFTFFQAGWRPGSAGVTTGPTSPGPPRPRSRTDERRHRATWSSGSTGCTRASATSRSSRASTWRSTAARWS